MRRDGACAAVRGQGMGAKVHQILEITMMASQMRAQCAQQHGIDAAFSKKAADCTKSVALTLGIEPRTFSSLYYAIARIVGSSRYYRALFLTFGD